MTKLKMGGVTQENSTGTKIDIIVGARTHLGFLRTKFGVAIAIGEERSRDYDYKIILGASYILNILIFRADKIKIINKKNYPASVCKSKLNKTSGISAAPLRI